MTLLLKPAIALSNSLRFSAKFSLLALMFYVPLIVSFIWIVKQQFQDLTQYQLALAGNAHISQVATLEQAVNQSRSNTSAQDRISSLMQSLELDGDSKASLISQWSALRASERAFSDFDMFYDKTFALRENIAAVSGLSREPDPQVFYLAEAAIFKLPALIEYMGRINDLNSTIIANSGFSAETYTLLVALNNRLDELQLQLKKTTDQLQRVAPEQYQPYISQYRQLVNSLDQYQLALNNNMIIPDTLLWNAQQAKQAGEQEYKALQSLMTISEEFLVERLIMLQKQSTQALWLLAIMLIVVMIAISYLLVGIYHSLNANVRNITQAAKQLGNGDFSQEICIASKDELGDIARQFSKMQQKIHSLLVNVEHDVSILKSAVVDINALTESMEKNIAQQQHDTHQVASSINQVNDSAKVIASNTMGAQQITEEASDKVTYGEQIIQDTAQVITGISKQVNSSADVINELAEHSSEIGTFVSVIREIADQTNLLALNAAIEAARAGEQGRGFAVVAGEVGTLAKRTQEATVEIQRIIEQLQLGTSRSVEAMKNGVEQAEQGVEKTAQVADTFHQVSGNVANIVTAALEISTAVEQQSEMVVGITGNTNDIADSTDNLLQSAEDAAGAGINLSKLADELALQLAQFTLKK